MLGPESRHLRDSENGINPRLKPKYIIRNEKNKTGYILVLLGSLDTLGLFANLNG